MLETRREPPPPFLAGNAFPHPPRLSLSLLSSIPFVFLPLFSIYSSFLTPSFFFLISYRIKAKLSVSVSIFLYSLNQKLYIQRRGAQGRLGEGAFFFF